MFDTVRIVTLHTSERTCRGARLPRVGDIGIVVQIDDTGDGAAPILVECPALFGYDTVWLADFSPGEVERID